jgi:hypothetical protein
MFRKGSYKICTQRKEADVKVKERTEKAKAKGDKE